MGEARARTPGAEGGFTLIELTVVLAIMGVVLLIAGGALISLQKTTVRTGAMVSTEQDASTVLAQMARDIRSTHAITFPSLTTTNAADTVILYVNQPSGGNPTPVEWVYQPPIAPATVGTLEREVLDSSLSVVSTATELTDVANGSAAVFSYYPLLNSTPITPSPSDTQNSTIATCTTGIGVTLDISPAPVTGVSNFQESDEVAITDQEQILSAPGNQQCGKYGY